MIDDDAYKELCDTLRQEALEQVERIGRELVELEEGVGDEEAALRRIDEAFRQAHNLKGASGSLGFSLTAKLAHVIEARLEELRTHPMLKDASLYDALHAGLAAVPAALQADPGAESHPSVDPVIESLERDQAEENAPTRIGDSELHRARLAMEPPQTSEQPILGGAAAGSVEDDEPSETVRPNQTPVSSKTGDAEEERRPARALERRSASRTDIDVEPRDEALRVSSGKLKQLMTQVGELLAARLRSDQRLAELRGILSNEESRVERRTTLRSLVRDRAEVDDPLTLRLADAVREDLEHNDRLVRQLRDLVRSLEADSLQSSILSGELQEDIRRIQTFPLESLLEPLPRAVRNMAREAGKDARLRVEGAEVELDKKVLVSLRDPIYHLLRNAIDHGLEGPAERRRAGKPERGTVTIKAEHQGNSIVITVEDDGPGVDIQAVSRRVVELGLSTKEQVEAMSRQRLLDFIFHPGFSTRDQVSALSGRGVGLDSVRSTVESLHGTVTIDSRPGSGTTFSLVLPVTIYVVQSLILRVADQRYALPISAVQRILRVRSDEIVSVEEADAIILDQQPAALVPLASLLGVKKVSTEDIVAVPVVVVGLGDQRFAMAVDEIVGDETLLAKNFEPPLVRVRNVAGATILGDGEVILMLNPIDLLRSATSHDAGPRRTRHEDQSRWRILLADDSFTTRALERQVLEAAGFEVEACADGSEALAKLEAGQHFDLVVSDVNMPKIGGLELCRRVRADPRWSDMPIVLVTSLSSDEDRRQGLEAGADRYLVKRDFDHELLRAAVRELLGAVP